MSLSTLPSLCLLTIFDRIPLHDLLSTVNLVCNRWAQLRPVACHRRRSLLLYDSQHWIKNHCIIKSNALICLPEIEAEVVDSDGKSHFDRLTYFKALMLSDLSDRVCQQLVTLLPAITKLEISQTVKCWPTVVYHVNHLLEKWSPKLVHCSLWLNDKYEAERINGYSPTLVDSLFDRLNQLTSLKRLAIHLDCPSSYTEHNRVEDLYKLTTSLCPALSRVEHFGYGWDIDDQFGEHIYRDIESALEKADCSLKSITINPQTPLRRVTQFSNQFTAKVTNYRLNCNWQYSATDVLTMLARLKCLHTLNLEGVFYRLNLSFRQLIGRLSHLTQLRVLRFNHDFEHFFSDKLNLSIDVSQIVMPSVKALVITFAAAFSHSHLDRLSIPTLFPNVQVIKLWQEIYPRSGRPSFITCADCSYHLVDAYERMDDAECQRLLHNCARLSVKSLKQCVTLRWINFTRKCATSLSAYKDHVFRCNFTFDQI